MRVRSPIALLVLVVVAISAFAAACGGAASTAPGSSPPFATGTITQIDSTGAYRLESAAGTSPPVVLFRLTATTSIARDDGRPVTAADLQLGRMVSVWADGTVTGTPPKLNALRVLIY
jgi:hypothetical protein